MARGGKKHKKEQKKRKHDDINFTLDDSDLNSEDEQSQKLKKQKKESQSSGRKLDYQLPIPNWNVLLNQPVNNNLWQGLPGEINPSEELKLLRKSIGVNVKGNLAKSPPPVITIEDPSLPALFRQYFQHHHLSTPTSVQQQCWPCILTGVNVLGIAPTGSGKTLAYLLPAFHQLQSFANKPSTTPTSLLISPKILILVPTRELALQVLSVGKTFKPFARFKCGVLYGGHEKETQVEDLQQHGSLLKILIATPGRLLDVLGSSPKVLQLTTTSYTVIDEADRMLSLGFAEQLSAILTQICPDKQIVLFSATFPGNLRQLSDIWSPNAAVVRCNAIDLSNIACKEQPTPAVSNLTNTKESDEDSISHQSEVDEEQREEEVRTATAGESNDAVETNESFTSSITISPTVNQLIHICAPHKRPRLLIKYIEKIRDEEKKSAQRQSSPIIIFCTAIKTLKFVMEFLNRQKLHSVPLHGQLPQQKREENLNDLKSGKANIVIATDVAARGIHIKRLKYVVNYDFPSNIEQYCHRIGRVGRQGELGEAYSFMTRNFAPLANDLIALLKRCGKQPEPNLEKLALDYSLGKVLNDLDESLEDEADAEEHGIATATDGDDSNKVNKKNANPSESVSKKHKGNSSR